MNTIEQRFKEHIRESKKERTEGRPLYRAMRKYGIENFFIEELESCKDDLEGCEREKYWIEYFGSFKNGYNATLGGDGRPYLDYDLIFATYQQIQNCTKVAELLNVGVESVSKAVKLRGGVIKPSQEIAKKTFSKMVNMFTLNDEYIKTFPSAREAARYIQSLSPKTRTGLGGISTHISEVARGKRKSAYGYHWKYA